MKSLADYKDALGFIGHYDPDKVRWDYGDSAQREGMNNLFQMLKGELSADDLKKIEIRMYMLRFPSGEWRRHYDHHYWWGQPGNMSIDNFKPLLIFSGYLSKKFTRTICWDILKRGLFAWNTRHIGGAPKKFPIPDWGGFRLLGNILRVLMKQHPIFMMLWPLLLLTDIFLLANILILKYRSERNFDEACGDFLNASLDIIQAQEIAVTPISRCARGVLGSRRYVESFQHYFRGENAPPLDVEAEPVLRTYFR